MNREKEEGPRSGFFSWLIRHSFLMGRFFRRPGARELFSCFAACTIIGIFLGLVFGGLALVRLQRGSFAGSSVPLLAPIGKAIAQLTVFSTAFFLFCGLPGVLLVPRTLEMAPSIGRWVRGLLYFAGGTLAMTAGLLLLPVITGVHLFTRQIMIFIIAVDGIVTTMIGAIIFSYKRMELDIRRQMEALAEKERETAGMERLLDASRLSALQAQINPHFFFNTLNSIAALIPRDPKRAGEVVERLADLFRYTMKSSEETQVLLSEEMAFVRAYLEIEKLRYGRRLRVEERLDEAGLSCRVPGLLLQPVVENALRHGIAARPDGGALRIEARLENRENGRLRLVVADNGPGFGGSEPFRPGHALENIRKRLRLLYGEAATLTAGRSASGDETEMVFQLPVQGRRSDE
jgi:sensor histidine kinase YesM